MSVEFNKMNKNNNNNNKTIQLCMYWNRLHMRIFNMYINAIVRMQSFISFPRIFTEFYCNTFNLKQNKSNQIILKWNETKSGSFGTKSDFVHVEILFWGQYLLILIELAYSLNWMSIISHIMWDWEYIERNQNYLRKF